MLAQKLVASTLAAAVVGGALIATSLATAKAETAVKAGALTPPYVLIMDQKPSGASIVMKYIYMPVNGYVLVFATDGNGNPSGKPIGEIALKSGDHRDVKVDLNPTPKAKSTLFADIYVDKDGDGKYDPAKDAKYPSSGPEPGSNFFTIE